MAHKKAGSSSKNGRDSVGQRLGVKAGDGQLVTAGSIIVRQRGQTFLSGPGTGIGHDYTVFATTTGRVRFEHATRSKKRIRVIAADEVAAKALAASAPAEKPVKKAAPAASAQTAASESAAEGGVEAAPASRRRTTKKSDEAPAADA
jgi:large subunit ribosomal protein L27